MNTIFGNNCVPSTESELKNFEQEQNITFPEDYRKFLLIYNGGKPKPCFFDVDIDGFRNTSCITYFLCLDHTREYSLVKYIKSYKNRLPSNLIPIAIELSVDLICISVAEKDFGKVYFWDHNWEVTENTPDYSNVHFLADNCTIVPRRPRRRATEGKRLRRSPCRAATSHDSAELSRLADGGEVE